MKRWHLSLVKAQRRPALTFQGEGGGEVTLYRHKITVTNIDLGSQLDNPLIRVIRIEDVAEEPQGESSRSDAIPKKVEAPARKQRESDPPPPPPPVVEVPSKEAVSEEIAPEPKQEEAKVAPKPAPKKRAARKRTTKTATKSSPTKASTKSSPTSRRRKKSD